MNNSLYKALMVWIFVFKMEPRFVAEGVFTIYLPNG